MKKLQLLLVLALISAGSFVQDTKKAISIIDF